MKKGVIQKRIKERGLTADQTIIALEALIKSNFDFIKVSKQLAIPAWRLREINEKHHGIVQKIKEKERIGTSLERLNEKYEEQERSFIIRAKEVRLSLVEKIATLSESPKTNDIKKVADALSVIHSTITEQKDDPEKPNKQSEFFQQINNLIINYEKRSNSNPGNADSSNG